MESALNEGSVEFTLAVRSKKTLLVRTKQELSSKVRGKVKMSARTGIT